MNDAALGRAGTASRQCCHRFGWQGATPTLVPMWAKPLCAGDASVAPNLGAFALI